MKKAHAPLTLLSDNYMKASQIHETFASEIKGIEGREWGNGYKKTKPAKNNGAAPVNVESPKGNTQQLHKGNNK